MPQDTLPFPTRELAEEELRRDPCYEKIPAAARGPVLDAAWQKGADAARAVWQETGGERDFRRIARAEGLLVVEQETDCVLGGRRCFSDYTAGQGLIRLYLKSIDLWARHNGLNQDEAVNVILSHEYFHFLEYTKLGPASREYRVPMLVLGPLKLGKTGVRALSEAGAHAFAHTYYSLPGQARRQQESGHGTSTPLS